jgi:hypothetical protein
MCLTFTGRIHTRLAALIGPFVLTCVLVLLTGERDYFELFVVMAGSGLALELGVYGWLIRYQPRWLTVLLAIPEFMLIMWLMRLSTFATGLSASQAAGLFLVAWLISWLTLQIVLPLVRPRWVEDGGEFRLLRTQ